MAHWPVRLENIPPRIQKMYNIGPKVDATASDEVGGGSFEFVNNEGQAVEVDAVELFGTDIQVVDLR